MSKQLSDITRFFCYLFFDCVVCQISDPTKAKNSRVEISKKRIEKEIAQLL